MRRFILEKNGYYLYGLKAYYFDKSASEFFYKLGLVLTNQTPKIHPLWPVYRRSPYILYHNSMKYFVYMSGEEVEPTIAPIQVRGFEYKRLENQQSILARFLCTGREQVVVLNKHNPRLKQLILWRSDFLQTVNTPSVSVTDIKGTDFMKAAYPVLPYNGEMHINADFNGFVLVFRDNILFERREIKSGQPSDFYNIRFGYRFEIYQGMDKIRTVEFVREKRLSDSDEESFVKKLSQFADRVIPIPYDLSGIIERLDDYPEIQVWVRNIKRKGLIPEKAYKLLRKFVVTLEVKNDRH